MNQSCYKCGSSKDLSRRSKFLMVCRACRREVAKQYRDNRSKNPYRNQNDYQEELAWRRLARAINGAIMAKYADRWVKLREGEEL